MSIQEELMLSMDTIVKQELNSVKFDRTEICTIVQQEDTGETDQHTYLVSNEAGLSFQANGTQNYFKGQSVYVLIPQGNYELNKLIIGSYNDATEDKNDLDYINPFGNFVKRNIIEFGTVTNSNSASRNIEFFDKNNFDYLGLEFTGETTGITSGEYYIKIDFLNENNQSILTEQDKNLLTLSSKQIIGNPYNLIDSLTIQHLFPFETFNGYLISNNFKKINITLDTTNLIGDNISISIDPTLYFGYDKNTNKFKEGIELNLLNNDNYNYTSMSDNKLLTFDWYMGNDQIYNQNTPINGITGQNIILPENISDYDIYWLQYILGYNKSSDKDIEDSGTYWKTVIKSQEDVVAKFIPLPIAQSLESYIQYSIANDEVTITGCDTSIAENYIIPDTIEGYPVTGLGLDAFRNCTQLTGIAIPNNIIYIFPSAFQNCHNLISIMIPKSVTVIRDGAFFLCSNLTNVYYEGTETEWNNIEIGVSNTNLTNANIYYNSYNSIDNNSSMDKPYARFKIGIKGKEDTEIEDYYAESNIIEFINKNTTPLVTGNADIYQNIEFTFLDDGNDGIYNEYGIDNKLLSNDPYPKYKVKVNYTDGTEWDNNKQKVIWSIPKFSSMLMRPKIIDNDAESQTYKRYIDDPKWIDGNSVISEYGNAYENYWVYVNNENDDAQQVEYGINKQFNYARSNNILKCDIIRTLLDDNEQLVEKIVSHCSYQFQFGTQGTSGTGYAFNIYPDRDGGLKIDDNTDSITFTARLEDNQGNEIAFNENDVEWYLNKKIQLLNEDNLSFIKITNEDAIQITGIANSVSSNYIEFPSHLTIINNNESITYPVTLITSGVNSWSNKSNIKGIIFPKTLESFETGAFTGYGSSGTGYKLLFKNTTKIQTNFIDDPPAELYWPGDENNWNSINEGKLGSTDKYYSYYLNELPIKKGSFYTVTNAEINNSNFAIIIAQLQITNQTGSPVNLKAYYPIAKTNNNDYYIEGASRIVYDFQGSNPNYDKSLYNLYDENGLINDINWEIIYEDLNITNNEKQNYPSLDLEKKWIEPDLQEGEAQGHYEKIGYKLKPTASLNNTLQDCSIRAYIEVNGVQTTQYIQPLVILQNTYAFPLLNEWNESTYIDEKEGIIMSQLIGAGHKNADNQYTGVLMGTVSKAGAASTTGIYGFQNGALRYKLDEYGAFYVGNNSQNNDCYISFNENISGRSGTGQLKIKANDFVLNTNNLVINSTANNSENAINFKNKFIVNGNGDASIGGWTIGPDYLYGEYNGNACRITINPGYGYWIAASRSGENFNRFYVDTTGTLYATGANITGIITATEGGKIGGWGIGAGQLYSATDNSAMRIYSASDSSGYWMEMWSNTTQKGFRVTREGQLQADSAVITGTLNAGSIISDNVKIGNNGYTIFKDYIYDDYIQILVAGTRWCSKGYSSDNYIEMVDEPLAVQTVKQHRLYLHTSEGHLAGTWYDKDGHGISSDIRLKNSIEYIGDLKKYEDLFDNLKPVRYKYNEGTSDRYHLGFIAQEVDDAILSSNLTSKDAAIVMDCYESKTNETIKYLRYIEFIALNVAQIQKLKTQVAKLEKEIKEIKNETN